MSTTQKNKSLIPLSTPNNKFKPKPLNCNLPKPNKKPNKYYYPKTQTILNPTRLANQLKLASHHYDLKTRINLAKRLLMHIKR